MTMRLLYLTMFAVLLSASCGNSPTTPDPQPDQGIVDQSPADRSVNDKALLADAIPDGYEPSGFSSVCPPDEIAKDMPYALKIQYKSADCLGPPDATFCSVTVESNSIRASLFKKKRKSRAIQLSSPHVTRRATFRPCPRATTISQILLLWAERP